ASLVPVREGGRVGVSLGVGAGVLKLGRELIGRTSVQLPAWDAREKAAISVRMPRTRVRSAGSAARGSVTATSADESTCDRKDGPLRPAPPLMDCAMSRPMLRI